jgi:endonuclease YncB( thermonuclease family)
MARRRPVPLIQLTALILLLATGSAAASPLAEAAELRGTPQVLAGDLIQLQGRRLRLAGIDAPELGQRCALKARLYDCGEVARTALLDLTAGTEVRCRPLGPGPAGSTMARCFAAGYDLSEGMVYTGWAGPGRTRGSRALWCGPGAGAERQARSVAWAFRRTVGVVGRQAPA